jgi:hypothetical protein
MLLVDTRLSVVVDTIKHTDDVLRSFGAEDQIPIHFSQYPLPNEVIPLATSHLTDFHRLREWTSLPRIEIPSSHEAIAEFDFLG